MLPHIRITSHLDLFAAKLNIEIIYIGRHKLNIVHKKTITTFSIACAQNESLREILPFRN